MSPFYLLWLLPLPLIGLAVLAAGRWNQRQSALEAIDDASIPSDSSPLDPPILAEESNNLPDSLADAIDPTDQPEIDRLSLINASPIYEDSMENHSPESLAEHVETVPSAPPETVLLDAASEQFKQQLLDMLFDIKGKPPKAATPQDYYEALTAIVNQQCSAVSAVTQTPARTVVELSLQLDTSGLLAASLANLGLIDRAKQVLRSLDRDLDEVLSWERTHNGHDDRLGEVLSGYLEALATAGVPAIGYGLWQTAAVQAAECPEQHVQVGFGGYTQIYSDDHGYRSRWMPETTIEATPCDACLPGFGGQRASLLRLWKSADDASSGSPEEDRLKQCALLASCALQDLLRRHLQADDALETLPDRFVVQLSEPALAIAIAELMRLLVDEHQLPWLAAWSIAQRLFSCTFHHLSAAWRDRWSYATLNDLLPRHLEIISEIERQLLAASSQPLPLFDPDLALQTAQLIGVGCAAMQGVTAAQTRLIQETLLPAGDADKCRTAVTGIRHRQYLSQSNPRLTRLLNQSIGEGWLTEPAELSQVEPLVNSLPFCASWWQMKRDNKQELAALLYEQTGIAVNLNSLFDVQVAPVHTSQRQMLNLLHVITLYARHKINSNIDTTLRFAHRSVPRTFIFVGQGQGDRPIDLLIWQLAQSVATTINADPDLRGRMQAICLETVPQRLLSAIYAGADVAEQLSLADCDSLGVTALRFALNGVTSVATRSSMHLEMQQQLGANSIYPFGMTAANAQRLRATGCDLYQYYTDNAELRQTINLIAKGYFSSQEGMFQELLEWLTSDDQEFALADYQAFIDTQEQISQRFQDQKTWTRTAIATFARLSPFCADRTLDTYREAWQV